MNHNDLINMGKALGYSSITEAGLCRGFSSMWMQAVCANDLASFRKRYEKLKSFTGQTDFLKEKLAEAQQKVKKTLSLSEEDNEILEINVFFENIALYLRPNAAKEHFGEVLVQQHETTKIAPYIQSETLEKNGGLLSNFHSIDHYNHEELVAYLDKLHETLANRQDAAILLDSAEHSIAIQLMPEKKFRIIDTNNLTFIDSESAFSSEVTANIIPTCLFHEKDKKLIMETQVFTAANNPVDAHVLQNNTPIRELYLDESKNSILGLAARLNSTESLRRIDFEHVNVDTLHAEDKTALHFACSVGNKKTVKFLLGKNANPLAVDKKGLTPLHNACLSGNLEVVKLLFTSNKNIDVNQVDIFLRAPLSYAASNGNTELCSLLIEKGAVINPLDSLGLSPFDYACESGKKDLAAFFLRQDKTLDVNHLPTFGQYPLINAIKSGSYDLVAFLLENGANSTVTESISDKPALAIAEASGHDGIITLLKHPKKRLSYFFKGQEEEDLEPETKSLSGLNHKQ